MISLKMVLYSGLTSSLGTQLVRVIMLMTVAGEIFPHLRNTPVWMEMPLVECRRTTPELGPVHLVACKRFTQGQSPSYEVTPAACPQA